MTTESKATLENISSMSTEALRFELTEANYRAANGDTESKKLAEAITELLKSR